MSNNSVNNKRIAKNTLLLYVRMLVMMLVSLYTSRVVLNSLGVEDFGIYNVVGGVVVMMGVLNSSLSAATSRFITYELGRGDARRLRQVFSISVNIYVAYAALFVIVAEIAGLWLLDNKLTLPADKLDVAHWLFQFSVVSVVVSLLYNPYNAVIIAHEKMNVYAYLSVLEALLKLGVAFLILTFQESRLFYYGLFIMLSSLLVTSCYIIYCVRHYRGAWYEFYWEKEKYREILSFSGWNIFGSLANLAKGQGLNVMLNIFFSPSVNAARGIAYQVNNVVTQFFNNFYMAVRPQITKYYAQNEIDSMLKLVFRSSRFLFFLMLAISLPVIVETPFLINAWLGQTPDYVIPFTRLIILITVVDGMSQPLMTAVQATGKIKLYQIVVGCAILMILPVSYVFLKCGFSAVSVFYVSLAVSLLCHLLRLVLMKRVISFSIRAYMWEVAFRCLACSLLSPVAPVLLSCHTGDGFGGFIIILLVCLLSSFAMIWLVGMRSEDRAMLLRIVRERMSKASVFK